MDVREIAIGQIKGSLCKMRLEKDYEKEEMIESIRECGVLDPVKVKQVKGGYLIFAGHRRLECARELGLAAIRAEVWEGIADADAVLRGFVENINRKDFTILEEGHAYRKLIEEYSYKVEGLVKPCGKSLPRIYALIRLVKNLTAEMKRAIVDGKMSAGHAEWLLRIEDPKARERMFQEVLNGESELADVKYAVYRQKPDSEKGDKERELDIIEDICEKDPGIRVLWKKGIRAARSRQGLKFTIEVNGPLDLLQKFDTVVAPIRKSLFRFRR